MTSSRHVFQLSTHFTIGDKEMPAMAQLWCKLALLNKEITALLNSSGRIEPLWQKLDLCLGPRDGNKPSLMMCSVYPCLLEPVQQPLQQ